MKQITIALLIIIAILLGLNYCQKEVIPITPKQINIDSIRAIEREAYELKLLASSQSDTVIVYRNKWHKAKPQFDTLPCDTALKLCISICDTLIVKDSLLIGTQKKVINKLDSALNGWKLVHSIDSTTIIGLKKENKKLKRRVWFWKVTTFISSGLNGYHAVRG